MGLRKYMVNFLTGVLVLVAAVYLLAALGQVALSVFLGLWGGVSLVGGYLSSRSDFMKYSMQLEIFDYVIWFASALLLLVVINDALDVLGYSGSVAWPPAWTDLMNGARSLEVPVLLFCIIHYSFRPGRPDYYAFVAFVVTIDLLLKGGAGVFSFTQFGQYAMYLSFGLALASFGIYLILGRYAGWKLVVEVSGVAVALFAIWEGLYYLNQAGILTWIHLPDWWGLIHLAMAGFLLGTVAILFTIYLVSRTGIRTLLIATSVYALYSIPSPVQAFSMLLYLAVFSIAVWTLLGLAGG
jgi:hypothetical protein